MKRGDRTGERGAVMVMVALWLPVMLIFASFAIDAAHFWDFSRNLQNRADAAALAASVAYGNTCFSTPTQGQLDAIGESAQQYAGPPVGTPNANLPYGYTLPANFLPYQNQPNLAASAQNYHLILNGSTSWDRGGVDFEKGNLCSSTYSSPNAAATDVWVTQAGVPLFFPFLSFKPNISAHARVELQGIQSEEGVKPIAVSDATYTPCVTANFLDSDGNVIRSEKLAKEYKLDPVTGKPVPTNVWDSSGSNAKQIPMPNNGDPVTVQISVNNCSTTNYQETLYDYYDTQGHDNQMGLVYINNWGNPSAPTSGGAALLAAGGVSLVGTTGGPCDPYYNESGTACADSVDANVAFQPGLVKAGVTPATAFVQAVITSSAGTTKLPLTFNTNASAGTDWTSTLNPGSTTFPIQPDTGTYTVSIQWAQTSGTVGGKTCKMPGNGDPFSNANPCNGTILGPNGSTVLQRTFAGVNGTNACNNPNYDTGPLQWVDVGTTDATGNPIETAGANAFGASANPYLYVTASIQGLVDAPQNAGAADDICLRVAEKTSHGTGFVDCGQGNGTPKDQATLLSGCPVPPGIQKNTRIQPDGSLTCTPQITPWDCVANNPGESPPVLKGLDQLIGQGGAPGACAANNWGKTDAQGNPIAITLADPRALVMIITAPTDLFNTNGTGEIPIRDFAVFYVTGWSSKASGFPQGGVAGCNNNDPPPSGATDGEIWGHWTSIAVPSGQGSSNGQQCDPTQFGNCIAVLTR